MELVWTLLAMAWMEAAISLGLVPSSSLLKAGSDSFSRPPAPPTPPARCAGQGIPTGRDAATSVSFFSRNLAGMWIPSSGSLSSLSSSL